MHCECIEILTMLHYGRFARLWFTALRNLCKADFSLTFIDNLRQQFR